ncbi:MAG: prolyl-tRNA synthetase associated domain-containing protein [Deltaproteobacteria bacterium]|nr:prolyl-tRNA synthetase associated domain-containing protein [Deltaproteobacteria bacterium]
MGSNLYQILEELQIAYRRHDHEAAFTVQQADTLYGHLPGGHFKNLFLRNKKGDRHYLLVALSDSRVDLKAVRSELEESTLSFASPERLMNRLGLTPGSVSPFGLINDPQRQVVVLLDKGLLEHDTVNFHPNDNTATLSLSRQDFLRFLEHTGHQVRMLELPR